MSLTELVPGMRPGATGRNIILAALYLWMIGLWPVFAGYYVGRNYGKSADTLSRLPGISANGGLLTGIVVTIGGYVLLFAFIAAVPETDTDTAADAPDVESTANGVGEQPSQSAGTDDSSETTDASSTDTTDRSNGGTDGVSGTSDGDTGGSDTDSSSGSTDGSSDDTPGSTTDDSADGATGDSTDETTGESTDSGTGDSTTDGSDDSTEDNTDSTTSDTADGTTDDSSDDTSDDSTSDGSDDTTNSATGDSTDETTDDSSDDTTDDSTDSTTSDSTGGTTDDSTDSTTSDTTDGSTDDGTGSSSDSEPDTSDTSDGDNTVTVEVVDVVDGDTMDIEYENGTNDRVRLLGVDTPEIHISVSPDEYEGVPDSEAGRQCLDGYGDEASAFAEQELAGDTVQLQFDDLSDRRGSYDRLLVYIIDDGENFNHLLLEEGLARVYDSTFAESERFYETETQARDSQIGVWSCQNADDGSGGGSDGDDSGSQTSDSALEIVEIHEDAQGPGHERDNLNDEYVTFRNSGDEALDLSGWTVEDEADHQYTIPSGFTLEAGEEVTLHTGDGSDTDADLYWGSGSPVWNNGGDTVFVKNAAGELVVERSYT